MPTIWTISHTRGGRDGQDLVGCHIQPSTDGLHYEFTAPDNTVLSTTTGSTLPSPSFSFPTFQYPTELPGWDWNIQVTTLTAGKHGNKAEGTWNNNDPNPANDESGTFTAQAGQNVEEDGEADAAAASA